MYKKWVHLTQKLLEYGFLAKFYSDQRNYQKFEEWILKAYIIYESTFLRDGTCRDNVGFYLNVILQRIHYKNKYSDRLTDEEVYRHSINSGIGLAEINEARRSEQWSSREFI